MKNMKHLLQETYNHVSKVTGYNMRSASGSKSAIADPNAFKHYVRCLSEGLDPATQEQFVKLAINTRRALMESNSTYQVSSYETLVLPVIRNFYPKLIAKELVTVIPINKPNVILPFITAKFRRMTSDGTSAAYTGYNYTFPSTTDISKGPSSVVDGTLDTTSTPTNVLTAMGIDSSYASHIERSFKIIGIMDSTGQVTTVDIKPTIDGNFSVAVTHTNTDTDVLSGSINYNTGVLNFSSGNGNTIGVRYYAVASLEENSMNAQIQWTNEKYNIDVVDRKIEAAWTPNIEQDVKALYDINIQSELINFMGEQIAMDIDREIINDLINENTSKNASSHTATFYKRPNSAYALGQKEWTEDIIYKLNGLSAQIYNDTLMGSGNTLACNPLDAALFESLNGFEYLGDSVAGGEVGYRSATVASGKYKLLVSSNVPSGKIVTVYRSEDVARAVYCFCPYVPALLTPYPLGNNPSMSILSRYGTRSIRPKGIAVLNVSDTTNP